MILATALGEKIKPHTIGEKGTRGGNEKNTRQFINGVFWISHTGASWRDLPAEYEHWKNVHLRFCRWRDKSIWENISFALIEYADVKWLLSLFSFENLVQNSGDFVWLSAPFCRSSPN